MVTVHSTLLEKCQAHEPKTVRFVTLILAYVTLEAISLKFTLRVALFFLEIRALNVNRKVTLRTVLFLR